MLLQVVVDTGDIRGHFFPVGQPHPGDLPQGGVGLLGRLGLDDETNAPPLRASLDIPYLGLARLLLPPQADKLSNTPAAGA